MALCMECKRNTAVVFVNKVIDGKPSVEGLCLACARKKGINPLSSLMKQYGATDDEIQNMNNQFDEIINSMDGMNMDDMLGGMPSPDGMPNETPDGETPIDSFTKSKFFAEKCGDTETAEKEKEIP